MRWKTGRRSENVEDRRGEGGLGGFPGDGTHRARIPVRMGRKGVGGGLGTIVLVLALLYFGVDPSVLIDGGGPGLAPEPRSQVSAPVGGSSDELAEFVSVVLADTEDTWHALFREGGEAYREPSLVLYTGMTSSACGFGQAAMGPFYCPADEKVYIDLAFYDEMRTRFGAPGDFAQAYVIAHEVGHHVQNLLGISDQVQTKRRVSGETEGNQLSVRLELQADCLAGVWAHHADRARNVLEPGDLEEALTAAAAIGDDRLQKQARGRVAPDSFTHGSSEQRVRWFRRGMEEGRMSACDTFSAQRL
ncbi:MAG: neutral zinc metallopeptidase [Chromatiaceae bacterium]|jgi:predicted metalloprotease|nr:neutral zinc metallopeptidase [Chromatiaceae bacterium]